MFDPQMSQWQLETIQRFQEQYPEIVELGRSCAWVRNEGNGIDIAADLATELGWHIREHRVAVPNTNGYTRVWGWVIQ